MSRTGGKVAIITGGSQGIGASLVAAYRRQGWSVVATSRTIRPTEDPDVLTVDGDIADRLPSRTTQAPARLGPGRADQGRPGLGHRSLAIECASRGIRVNAISLGIIQTPMHPADSYDDLGDRLPPLRRVGQISDVVDGILFLEASPYITGEILHIDGGQIAGH
jgi:NAD(P)-dependent dehydrogenase (short-subunit alcohol dehydrogenase family)